MRPHRAQEESRSRDSLLAQRGGRGSRLSSRLDDGCRTQHVRVPSSLLTAGAKAAVLSGAVTLNRADLLQHIEPLETGAATTRDLARIGTALARTFCRRGA